MSGLDKPEKRGRPFQGRGARHADKGGRVGPFQDKEDARPSKVEMSYSGAARNYVEKDEPWDLIAFLIHGRRLGEANSLRT